MREGFDSNNASTWSEEERAVYETGYREGGSSNAADWAFALTEFCELPGDVDSDDPRQVAEYITRLQGRNSQEER